MTPVIPHLWLALTDAKDIPSLSAGGFDIPAPDLPRADGCTEAPGDGTSDQVTAHFGLSVCSANVRSLHTSPEGHAGKTQFLRRQMQDLHFNVLGLQETRTVSGQSQADQVLRLSSGSQDGHYGVELWINLLQPYAYVRNKPLFFCPKNFVVLRATPRLLSWYYMTIRNFAFGFW